MHGIVYVAESDTPQDPLDVEVRKLLELVELVKDEQSYIVVRERTHRNTAESTNSRVKWWNLFVIGVVIGESVFQVWWLRRFFEVRGGHGFFLTAFSALWKEELTRMLHRSRGWCRSRKFPILSKPNQSLQNTLQPSRKRRWICRVSLCLCAPIL